MQASFTKKKPTQTNRLAEYQDQGIPHLVAILEQKGSDFVVLNSQNAEITIASNRVYQIAGKIPPQFSHRTQIVSYLKELIKESNKIKNNVNLDRAWEAFRNSDREVTLEQIQRQLFPNQNLANLIAVRWALLSDKFYFKRGKSGFTARAGDSIEAIKLAVAAEEEKITKIKDWSESIISNNPSREAVAALEKTAALGRKYDYWPEVEELLNFLDDSGYKIPNKRIEDQAFDLLVNLGIFSKHENLTTIKVGRVVSFSEEEISAAKSLELVEDNSELSALEVFTIDGDETKDFDDGLSIQKSPSGYTVGIHIADVSSYIKPGDILWNSALLRSSTVYTADQNYPMLPHVVSEEFLSLVKDKIRNVVSTFVNFDTDFNLINFDIKKQKIAVKNRITYNQLDGDFEKNTAREELLILNKLSQKLEQDRINNGAKILPKREMLPVINEQGKVKLEVLNEETPARKLVGEMMILANFCMASYAKDHNIPFIYRHQAAPESKLEQDSIQEGPAREYALRGMMKRSELSCTPNPHSGLALSMYCQSTSPIRRAIDLINQYQINQSIKSEKTLSTEELEKLIPELDTRLGEVTYLQRKRHRYWLLVYLEQQKPQELEGTVVRCDGPKPLVEIDNLFMISQYYPIKNKAPILGTKIKLKLEQISARLDRLKLNEFVN